MVNLAEMPEYTDGNMGKELFKGVATGFVQGLYGLVMSRETKRKIFGGGGEPTDIYGEGALTTFTRISTVLGTYSTLLLYSSENPEARLILLNMMTLRLAGDAWNDYGKYIKSAAKNFREYLR
jgi:hypothetical protein